MLVEGDWSGSLISNRNVWSDACRHISTAVVTELLFLVPVSPDKKDGGVYHASAATRCKKTKPYTALWWDHTSRDARQCADVLMRKSVQKNRRMNIFQSIGLDAFKYLIWFRWSTISHLMDMKHFFSDNSQTPGSTLFNYAVRNTVYGWAWYRTSILLMYRQECVFCTCSWGKIWKEKVGIECLVRWHFKKKKKFFFFYPVYKKLYHLRT